MTSGHLYGRADPAPVQALWKPSSRAPVMGTRRPWLRIVLTMADAPTTRSRRGRPAQISRELIVDAAISAGNLDTLTMRELAARLGVTHAALYRWVKNRDQLFDTINEVMVERILPAQGPHDRDWRPWLAHLAWGMHDQFLALPGYATRISRPHRHTTQTFGRLRSSIITAFTAAGVPQTWPSRAGTSSSRPSPAGSPSRSIPSTSATAPPLRTLPRHASSRPARTRAGRRTTIDTPAAAQEHAPFSSWDAVLPYRQQELAWQVCDGRRWIRD